MKSPLIPKKAAKTQRNRAKILKENEVLVDLERAARVAPARIGAFELSNPHKSNL